MTAIDPATNGHGGLRSEVAAYIADCCTRRDPIRGIFFRSCGTADSDGQIDVEIRRINFADEDLVVRATLRLIEVSIAYPDGDEQRELPGRIDALGLPVGGTS